MTIISDTKLLHPKFRFRVESLNEYLSNAYQSGLTKTHFKVFETFRDPIRQAELLTNKVTKAAQFQSAHQFGLATDFVPYLNEREANALSEKIGVRVWPGWNWHSSHDYGFLAASGQLFQVSFDIAWDPCHGEHPKFGKMLNSIRTYIY